ncbi:NAD(P)-dependent oxidoreductase [Candidatus Poribacteria bacterium]|nr:NAD(P)-dependent oxidoreductase [Candidatus Poribacteria bacterium]
MQPETSQSERCVLLTGGSGDLASSLAPRLEAVGARVLRLDPAPPRNGSGVWIEGSILDRAFLSRVMGSVHAVVHIAGWHGIHESRGWRQPAEFWDLNATGTFNVLEAVKEGGVKRLVHLSSTSVRFEHGIYGHTKRIAEETVRWCAREWAINAVLLRPRGFIPPENRAVYADFIEWAKWFWNGAVHITDVVRAVELSLGALDREVFAEPPILAIDRAPDYTEQELAEWDATGPGSTFRGRFPEFADLAERFGFDLARKPSCLDIAPARSVLGYNPKYGLRAMLEELASRQTR